MKRSLVLAAAMGILFGGSVHAAEYDTTNGYDDGDTARRGVLCGVWVTRSFFDRLIGVDEDTQSFTQTTYPVPAPIWVAQSINSAYLALVK